MSSAEPVGVRRGKRRKGRPRETAFTTLPPGARSLWRDPRTRRRSPQRSRRESGGAIPVRAWNYPRPNRRPRWRGDSRKARCSHACASRKAVKGCLAVPPRC